MAKKSLPIVIFLVILLSVSQAALASIGSSSNYILEIADISNSVTTGSSASYGLDGTTGVMGDLFEGQSSSDNYSLCAGYIEESTGECVIETPAPPTPPPPSGGSGPVAGGRPDDTEVPTLDFELQPTETEDAEPEETAEPDLHGAAKEPIKVPATTELAEPSTLPTKTTPESGETESLEPSVPVPIDEPDLQPEKEDPCDYPDINIESWYIQQKCQHYKIVIEEGHKPTSEKVVQTKPQTYMSYWLLVPYIPLLALLAYLLWKEIKKNHKKNKKKRKR